jgi:hypothetical protein
MSGKRSFTNVDRQHVGCPRYVALIPNKSQEPLGGGNAEEFEFFGIFRFRAIHRNVGLRYPIRVIGDLEE